MYNLSLDESGNIGSIENKFFIISILQLELNKCSKLKNIRRILSKKFKKELKRNNEIKFYSQPHELTKKALNALNELNFQSYSIVINKNNPLNKRLLKKRPYNQIYMDMVIELLKKINLQEPFILKMDRYLPRKNIKQLNSNIMNNPHIYTDKCEILHGNSVNFLSIQFADLIAGSCFQSFERNNHDFLKIIEKNHKIFYYKKSNMSKI